MSQKRPLPNPLPIFNKGKRPRQALIAHPNNQGLGCTSQEASGPRSQLYGGMSSRGDQENSNPYSLQKPKQHGSTYGSNKSSSFDLYEQRSCSTYRSSDSSSCNLNEQRRATQDPNEQWRAPQSTLTNTRSWTSGNTGERQWVDNVKPTTAANPKSGALAGGAYNNPVTVAVGNVTAQAHEPTPTQTANHARSSSQFGSSRKQDLRVLTATAQGVEHWSKYVQHTRLLFEVYGKLVSAPKRDNNAQHFTLSTADGPLSCIFWEMEQDFPGPTTSTAQGHASLRVVGDWEKKHKRLKCYSVRLALEGEERVAGQCVMEADRHMREMAEKVY